MELRCAQCKCVLDPTGIYATNHLGEPLCSACTTIDDMGEICPHCGRKVPRDWIVSGTICKECFNEDGIDD